MISKKEPSIFEKLGTAGSLEIFGIHGFQISGLSWAQAKIFLKMTYKMYKVL